MARPVGQHHGDLRRALLDAALELVAEGAVRDVTLRAVARRAGVSPGAPYHHFADKDALLAAVAREGWVRLAEVQAGVAEDDPSGHLRELVAAYVRFALAHRTHYRVMVDTMAALDGDPAAVEVEPVARDTFATLGRAIRAADPSLDDAAALRCALVVWSLAHGAVDVAAVGSRLDPSYRGEQIATEIGRAACRLVRSEPA